MTTVPTRPATPPCVHSAPVSVSVVICAYSLDRWQDLVRVVGGVAAQSVPVEQTVLVVDHNAELLARARQAFPAIAIVANTGARGLSGARNAGIERATADVIAFIDDDATPRRDWLERLLRPFRAPDVLGVGGAAAPVWPHERPGWWPHEFDWVIGCSYEGLPEEQAPVRNLMGCSMAFRREVFDEVRFREGLGRIGTTPLGCEETELCIRARQHRQTGRFIYEPASVVDHRVSDDRVSPRYFLRRCLAEGRSKAQVVDVVGSDRGLASERSYAVRVLTRGVGRALGEALRGRPSAVGRAVMIVAGFVATAAGYVAGRVRRHPAPPDPQAHAPTRVAALELTAPVPHPTELRRAGDRLYRHARVLVRLAGAPVGIADVDLHGDRRSVATAIWSQLREPIGRRLEALGEPPVDELGPDGLDGLCPAPPATDLPDVAVVIATRDRAASLDRCLRSIRAGDHRPAQIVVVDSAPSTDETRRLIERDHPDVDYVHEPRPGLGLAHNRALPVVRTPVLAITDDDVDVDPAWTRVIAEAFAADPAAGCVTGLIVSRELDTPAQWWIERHGAFGKGFEPRRYHLDAPPADQPLFPYTAGALGSGANMAFRTEALRAIGGFDAALGAGSPGIGGDDLAAFVDVLLAGHALRYEPSAIIWHAAGREAACVTRQARNYGVGLGAYLTRLVMRRPRTLGDLVLRLPAVAAHVATRRGTSDVPDEFAGPRLLLTELRGLLGGPAAYRRSLRGLTTSTTTTGDDR